MSQVRTPPVNGEVASAPRLIVRPRRGLPNGRAIVGGLLVAAAAVGVFAAYSSAVAPPRTRYAVAARDLRPGDRIDAGALRLVAIHLPDEQRRRSFDDVTALVDTTVVEPLQVGELVQEGSIVSTNTAPGARSISFPIEPARAVDATVRPGERVDVFATFGTGADACTHRVAADVAVLAVTTTDTAVVGQTSGLTVTVEVADAGTGGQVAHASSAGALTLVRTTGAGPAGVGPFCTPAANAPSDTG